MRVGAKIIIKRLSLNTRDNAATNTLVRVIGPLAAPTHWTGVMTTSAVLFGGAFAVYVGIYVPVLLAPRVDGRPG